MKFEVTLGTDNYAIGQIVKTFSMDGKSFNDETEISPNLSVFSDLVIKQLLKLYCFRDNSDYEYEWVSEIFRILHKVPKIKSTEDYPSKRFLSTTNCVECPMKQKGQAVKSVMKPLSL